MTVVTASTTSSSGSSTPASTTSARFLGAGCAGALELALFHPVDTVAKRLMASPVRLSVNNYGEVLFHEPAAATVGGGGGGLGTAPNFVDFARMQQRVKSLFPGLGYGAVYKISQRSYKFGGQPFVKDLVRRPYERFFGSDQKTNPVRRGLLCDGVAGAFMGAGEVLLLPFDVLKIKAQTNPTYRGRNFVAVFRQEGLRNLYAGWQWTVMRNVPGSFALFGVNAAVRDRVFLQPQSTPTSSGSSSAKAINKNKPTFLQTAITSTCGSLASIVVACPCDVIKTRIQSGKFSADKNGVTIAKELLKEEGPSGFFKGVVPKCGAVGPKLIFSFTVAQYLIQTLSGV
ncbi:unnamed protein product [Amoebophrya sp. A120]|nr:unnamed protein product [Amoebophrya sp. A120]|eukprot:GSA120T00020772001.1